MNEDPRPESSEAAPDESPKPKKTRAKKSTASAGAKDVPAKLRKTAAKSTATKAAAKSTAKKKAPSKRKTTNGIEIEEVVPLQESAGKHIEDPIGDVSDGEGRIYTGQQPETESEAEAEAYRAGVSVDAVDGTMTSNEPKPDSGEEESEGRAGEEDFEIERRPPGKLERLQKILSQAGIASRRRAEEMIVAGRVMVNGQVVTALGSKADPQRDHIRVDGKLLQGAERHRYFVLNKPKGYVTTVSDPEGRPTVMDFVQKLGERVYPVGRLDYQSEGLLLMTNDGHLANLLTKASSGVEKTYLVKAAGQPDEEELERLRAGVMIERGGPSDSGLYGAGGRVRTAPAKIRQIRPGDNPWFEVVLTEGRNRELRKMFAAIGHYVEKIRRVGYGPLALDVEPGKLRELTPDEVDALQRTAEGKLKPRRLKAELMLPKDAGRSTEQRAARPYGKRGAGQGPERGPKREFRRGDEERGRPGEGRGNAPQDRPRREFRGERGQWQPRPGGERSSYGKPQEAPRREFRGERREWQPRSGDERASHNRPDQAKREFAPRRGEGRGGDTGRRFGDRTSGGRLNQPPKEFGPRRQEGRRGETGRGFGERPAKSWTGAPRPFRNENRPAEGGRDRGERPFRNEGRPPAGRWPKSESERPFRGQGRPAEARGQSRSSGAPKFGARNNSGPGSRGGRGPGRPGGQGRPGGFRGGPPRGGKPGGGKRRG